MKRFTGFLFRRLFSACLFFLLPVTIFAQENDTIVEKSEPAAVNTNSSNLFDSAAAVKFRQVDEFVLKMKKRNKPIPVLAKEITAPFSTEEEKVRAIFMWMTNNIAYDCVAYHAKSSSSGNFSFKTQEELIEKLDQSITKRPCW